MLPDFWIGGFQFFSYPLILGIIWALSFQLSKKLIQQRKIILPHYNLLFFVLFVLAWVGAKILFLLTLDEQLSGRALTSSNFWLGGGFVFYGGLILSSTGLIIYKYAYKIPWKKFNFVIPILALGHGIGRIACFLAGCCFGSTCNFPWAVEMHGALRHPVQIYESLGLLIIFAFTFHNYSKERGTVLIYIISYSLLRFVLEFFRGDKIRGIFYLGLSTSQLISLSAFALCVTVMILKKLRK